MVAKNIATSPAAGKKSGHVYFKGQEAAAKLAELKLKTSTKKVNDAAGKVEHAMDRFAFGNSNPSGYGTINAPGLGVVKLSRDYPLTMVKGGVVEVQFEATTKAHKNVDPEVTRQRAEAAVIDWLQGEFSTRNDRDPNGFGVPVEVAVKVEVK